MRNQNLAAAIQIAKANTQSKEAGQIVVQVYDNGNGLLETQTFCLYVIAALLDMLEEKE